jgi:hypothetical protein
MQINPIWLWPTKTAFNIFLFFQGHFSAEEEKKLFRGNETNEIIRKEEM